MMLPASVRRVLSSSHAPASALAVCCRRGLPPAPGSSSGSQHQRRCSSSKTSSPDNGRKDIPARQQQQQSSSSSNSVPASSSAKSAASGGEKRKRRGGGGAQTAAGAAQGQAAAPKLPSVPSTQHLPIDILALSSFFSQHRPISITHSLPRAVSEDAFATIFAPAPPRARKPSPTEVVDTLSRTVKQLETPPSMAAAALRQHESEAETDATDDSSRGAMHHPRIELVHPDGTESGVYVQLSAMAGQFLPFRPPPLPRAADEGGEDGRQQRTDEPETEASASASPGSTPQRRVYKAVLTIEEHIDADGQIKIVAHSPQIMEEASAEEGGDQSGLTRTPFLDRMARRHRMLAISVRRQKKLKMKKKKYKKLMRRTRNLRRKQDRL